ncbi:hypothetical protein OT109_15605 [Phycisphaeraceae bacterium D3-23]
MYELTIHRVERYGNGRTITAHLAMRYQMPSRSDTTDEQIPLGRMRSGDTANTINATRRFEGNGVSIGVRDEDPNVDVEQWGYINARATGRQEYLTLRHQVSETEDPLFGAPRTTTHTWLYKVLYSVTEVQEESGDADSETRGFLYSDRPSDGSGEADRPWGVTAPDGESSRETDTPVVTVGQRRCNCWRHRRDRAAGGQTPEEPEDPIDFMGVELLVPGYMVVGEKLSIPVEFVDENAPKVLTLKLTEENARFPDLITGPDFEDMINQYRFRTDHPLVSVELFLADGHAQVERQSDDFEVKVAVTFREGLRAGETINIILQRNEGGTWTDLACLRYSEERVIVGPRIRDKRIKIVNLSELSALEHFFGTPDIDLGAIGIFVDRSNGFVTFRLTHRLRNQLRQWAEGPAIEGIESVHNSRENALALSLLLLWYLNDDMIPNLVAFFRSPLDYIGDQYRGQVQGELQSQAIDEMLSRSMFGRVQRSALSPVQRERLSAARTRVDRILSIPQKLADGLQLVMRVIRINQFIDSVLRDDIIYSTPDRYFFVSFLVDTTTMLPNGTVATNFLPLDGWASYHANVGAAFGQLLFWESTNFWYFDFMDIHGLVSGSGD